MFSAPSAHLLSFFHFGCLAYLLSRLKLHTGRELAAFVAFAARVTTRISHDTKERLKE